MTSPNDPRLKQPLLDVRDLSHFYGPRVGCRDVSFSLWPGEIIGIVGESGSGKTTLLNCLSAGLEPSAGEVFYHDRLGRRLNLWALSEPERRMLTRTDWGVVHQNPRDGLRMDVSAGANIGERLMAVGARHYGDIRAESSTWMRRVEIELDRLDDRPGSFSGGMQQRLQIARNLVSGPRLA
ncbi:MAG: ATP-binding cassette domain-containing protein, partial [Rhodospirillales bacterium]|nr:ATP-binding cassette domain-containing protein [Rhodospirillales bacterium]